MKAVRPLVSLIALLCLCAPAAAQQGMGMRPGPLGEPWSREASGTAWLPDASPTQALHGRSGNWDLMLHGALFVHALVDGGERGHEQFGATSWIMGMARRSAAGGDLVFRSMLSADVLTAGECGYPDLLATGESCDGEPLHDRQHPHDVIMELAVLYERALTPTLAFQLYGGPAGEPALGPVAFPHRASAAPNPIAPIGHHWLDSTHIAFGVATAGLHGRSWKVEGSLFNGREPDEDRADLDLAELDSWAGRLWLLPNERWAIQVSAGRLSEAEIHEPDDSLVDVTRLTASAMYHHPLAEGRVWASTVAWGRNRERGVATDALLVETSASLDERNGIYGRLEVVEKGGEDLVLPETVADRTFTVAKLGMGVVRQLNPVGSLAPGFGAGFTLARVPASLRDAYGSRTPVGGQVFFQLRPAARARMAAHAP